MSCDVKKLIGSGSIFLLCLVIIVAGIEWRLHQNVQIHTGRHYQVLFNQPQDVLILGSSRSLHGIKTSLLKDISHEKYDFSRTLNFSIAGATSPYWIQWINHLLPQSPQKPSLVILSVNRLSSPRGIEHDSHFFPPSTLLKLFLNEDISRSTLLKNSLLSFTIGKRLAYVLKPEKTGWWKNIDEYDSGYVPIDMLMDETHESVYHDKIEELNKGELAAISEIIDIFQAQGTDVLLVRTPSYLTLAPHERRNAFTAELKTLAAQKDVPFLNYDTDYKSGVNTERTHFKDWMHLRRPGAEAFTLLLKRDLQRVL